MAIKELSASGKETVRQCMKAIADGPEIDLGVSHAAGSISCGYYFPFIDKKEILNIGFSLVPLANPFLNIDEGHCHAH
jgi:hypothetical protein